MRLVPEKSALKRLVIHKNWPQPAQLVSTALNVSIDFVV